MSSCRLFRAAAGSVAAPDMCAEMTDKTDDPGVCSMAPEPFYGVGMRYRDSGRTSDGEVSANCSKKAKH